MELTKYNELRLKYQERAKQRDVERISLGSGVDDTPYWNKVIEEMLIDVMDRLDAIEKLYEPAPAEVKPPEEKASFTSRLKLG